MRGTYQNSTNRKFTGESTDRQRTIFSLYDRLQFLNLLKIFHPTERTPSGIKAQEIGTPNEEWTSVLIHYMSGYRLFSPSTSVLSVVTFWSYSNLCTGFTRMRCSLNFHCRRPLLVVVLRSVSVLYLLIVRVLVDQFANWILPANTGLEVFEVIKCIPLQPKLVQYHQHQYTCGIQAKFY